MSACIRVRIVYSGAVGYSRLGGVKQVMRGMMRTDAGLGVVFAPMVWSDVDDVIDEYDAMWGMHSSDPHVAEVSRLLSAYCVYHYIALSTGAEVARMNGRFLGVLMTRLPGRFPLFGEVGRCLEKTGAELDAGELGRKMLALVRERFDEELELENRSKVRDATQAEVELFIVSDVARGRGVGRGLWSRTMSYLRDADVKCFYLHTDSQCDVSFYDAHGMDCVVSHHSDARPSEKDEESATTGFSGPMGDEMFIYVGDPRRIRRTTKGRHHKESVQALRGEER